MPAYGITLFGADRFGRRTIPGSEEVITENRRRRWLSGQKNFFHRTPNGVYDPITHFQVVTTLLDVIPNERFTAKQLVKLLEASNNTMSWDAVTIGRVLTDLHDSIELANGDNPAFQPIIAVRHWTGNHYYIADYPTAREVLARLADDLYKICEKEVEVEAAGRRSRRLGSPLSETPSLTRPIAG